MGDVILFVATLGFDYNSIKYRAVPLFVVVVVVVISFVVLSLLSCVPLSDRPLPLEPPREQANGSKKYSDTVAPRRSHIDIFCFSRLRRVYRA